MPKPNRGKSLQWRQDRGVWEIVWYERGRRRTKSTGADDRGEAERRLADELVATEVAGIRDPARRKIADVLADYVLERGPHVAAQARMAEAVKALIPFWGAHVVGDIREGTIRAYGKQRKVKDGTLRRELIVLRAAVNHDYKAGRLTATVPVWMPKPPDHKDRWLTRDEAASLLRGARAEPKVRPHLPLFILLGLYTGARKEAILSLRWTQVDLERRLIDFNQPGRERTSKGRPIVPISTRLMTFLRLMKRLSTPTGYVVSYRPMRGKKSRRKGPPPVPRRVRSIRHSFDQACERAGLTDVTPHVLRHTSASWMAQAGVPFPKIAGFLGHRDSRVTEAIYSHHAPGWLSEATGALDRRKR